MRRYSFGGGGGGMGGGSGGGGGMFKTVHRAVRAGVGGTPPEPFSHSMNAGTIATVNSRNYKKQSTPPNNNLTLSSSSSSAGGANDKSSSSSSGNNNNNNTNNNSGLSAFSSFIYLPLSAASGAFAPAWKSCSSPTCSDDMEWECVEGNEDERARVFYEDFVFGTVPSRDEVHHAVSALQQVLGPSSIRFPNERLDEDIGKYVADEVTQPMRIEKRISSNESEVDWTEPSMHLCNSGMSEPGRGLDRVYDAFHLLQTEPSVQRMVISLSSDKAVWDAVLNNDVVKEIRGSICQVEDEVDESPVEGSDDSNPVIDILSQVFIIAKAKIMQVIDKITKLVNEVFKPPNEEEKEGIPDNLEEKLKTSMLLSIVVLLIVVVTRLQSA